MIGPAVRLSEVRGAHARRIESALRDSIRTTMPGVMGMFERMMPRRKRLAGRRAVGARMGMKFAAGVGR